MTAIDTRLNEIAARADAATHGPWRVDRWEDFIGREITYSISGDTEVSPHIQEHEDAEFIAAARTDVPALVAALRTVLRIVNDETDECHLHDLILTRIARDLGANR